MRFICYFQKNVVPLHSDKETINQMRYRILLILFIISLGSYAQDGHRWETVLGQVMTAEDMADEGWQQNYEMLCELAQTVCSKDNKLVAECADGVENNTFYDKYCAMYELVQKKNMTCRKYTIDTALLGAKSWRRCLFCRHSRWRL